MPLVNQVPWAIFCKFKTAEGIEGSKLIYLNKGQRVDDCIYEVSKKCVEASGRTGVNVWLEDHHVIMADDDEPMVNYQLS